MVQKMTAKNCYFFFLFLQLVLTYDSCVMVWDMSSELVCTLFEPKVEEKSTRSARLLV